MKYLLFCLIAYSISPFGLVASASEKNIEKILSDWDETMGLEYSTIKLRESSVLREYENSVALFAGTKAMKARINDEKVNLRELAAVSQAYVWKNVESAVFFPFVYCHIMGINPSVLLYYTEVNEAALMELLKSLISGKIIVQRKDIRYFNFKPSFKVKNPADLGFQSKSTGAAKQEGTNKGAGRESKSPSHLSGRD